MRQPKYLEWCCFQELQDAAEKLPKRTKSSDNVVVGTEDDGALDELNG